MEENIELEKEVKPEPEKEEKEETAKTIPQEDFSLPVKFNKQLINLNFNEACEYAQKGMKFDAISKDYEQLKRLAGEDSKSVAEFLNALEQERENVKKIELTEKCGGNEEIAQHILNLENGSPKNREMGFAELKECFPEFEGIEDLPEQVVENARLKGTLLLDEFLRYTLSQKQKADNAISQQKNAEFSSTGSQLNRKGGLNSEAAEFLRGLWR